MLVAEAMEEAAAVIMMSGWMARGCGPRMLCVAPHGAAGSGRPRRDVAGARAVPSHRPVGRRGAERFLRQLAEGSGPSATSGGSRAALGCPAAAPGGLLSGACGQLGCVGCGAVVAGCSRLRMNRPCQVWYQTAPGLPGSAFRGPSSRRPVRASSASSHRYRATGRRRRPTRSRRAAGSPRRCARQSPVGKVGHRGSGRRWARRARASS